MPGIFRRSIDLTLEEIKKLFALGIRAVNICKVSENLKTILEKKLGIGRINAEAIRCD
jgi:delta-aminolevulinic acid dehydratase/porphobilinogen synthase